MLCLFGYIPPADFGIEPVPVGDEEILNFNTPTYRYNGVQYASIGADSNGCLIAGGGSSEDNTAATCLLVRTRHGPTTCWRRSGPASAGRVTTASSRASSPADGVNSWFILEHQVNVFGTSDLRTFQGIGIDGVQDCLARQGVQSLVIGRKGFGVSQRAPRSGDPRFR